MFGAVVMTLRKEYPCNSSIKENKCIIEGNKKYNIY